jgi:UDP-N-acetylmuramoylalanine--D-glutamate ligase
MIGESGPALGGRLRAAGVPHVEEATSMDDAVRRADALGRALLAKAAPETVATVLLSPAATSFDMFVDYAARGRAFKDAVAELVRDRGRSAR